MAMTELAPAPDREDPPDVIGRNAEDFDLLEAFLDRARNLGVRTFKGDIKNKDGRTVWTIEVAFEREQPPRGTRNG